MLFVFRTEAGSVQEFVIVHCWTTIIYIVNVKQLLKRLIVNFEDLKTHIAEVEQCQ